MVAIKLADVSSSPLRLFSLAFSSRTVVYDRCLVTLPLIINEALQGLTPLPILVKNHSGDDQTHSGEDLNSKHIKG